MRFVVRRRIMRAYRPRFVYGHSDAFIPGVSMPGRPVHMRNWRHVTVRR